VATTQLGSIRSVNIDEQMREAYLDYAMSVIVARALPDARDGLKPVQRRILYAMHDNGIRSDAPFRKSARIVGEVLGKYHPHGDVAVYEAMARMAQDFSMRYTLVDGQGNFGSVDGDAPAAMRYTEARMAALGQELLTDIDKDTVDFADNFDGSLQEPTVLPASIPNLLINGSSGIAVGMSTSVPPHNLAEVCDALIYMLRQWEHMDEIDVHHLMQYIKGPDFPTGGILYRGDARTEEDLLVTAYGTGRSKLTVRAKAHIESLERGKTRIIVSEIPYQTNKAGLIERIADLVRDERLDGISDLRDESDRQGLRIVIECKSNTDPVQVLNDLFRLTPLQTTFSVIMLALVDGEPRTLTLKQALRVYLDHRLDVVRRRSEYDLGKARDRAHILQGLLIALTSLDLTIKIIRESANTEAARQGLIERLNITQAQANAILELQLRRLAALEREKLQNEFVEVVNTIRYLEGLLANPAAMRKVIADELAEVKTRYTDPRRTAIRMGAAVAVTEEDLMAHGESTWATLTVAGRLSRTYQDVPPKITAQLEDPPRYLLRSDTADILYMFTSGGSALTIPVQQLPLSDDPAAGGDVRSLVDIPPGDTIVGVVSFPPSFEEGTLTFATERGEIKRIRVSDLPGLMARPFKIMDLATDDRMIGARYTNDDDEIALITSEAQTIRFRVNEVRPTGLPAGGMRGIRLQESDKVVAAALLRDGTEIWTISEQGIAKSSPIADYPLQGRAGVGVSGMKLGLGDRLAAGLIGSPSDLVIILTERRKFRVQKFRAAPSGGRAIKGDFVISLSKTDRVKALTQIIHRPTPTPKAESPDASPSENGASPSANGHKE
jgi:DNA gyrase subunit A